MGSSAAGQKDGWKHLEDGPKEKDGWKHLEDGSKEKDGWKELEDGSKEKDGWKQLEGGSKEKDGWISPRRTNVPKLARETTVLVTTLCVASMVVLIFVLKILPTQYKNHSSSEKKLSLSTLRVNQQQGARTYLNQYLGRKTMLRMMRMMRMMRMWMRMTIQISSIPGGLPGCLEMARFYLEKLTTPLSDLRTFYRGSFTNYVAESHSIVI